MKLLNRASVLAVLAISLVTAPIAVGAAETAKAPGAPYLYLMVYAVTSPSINLHGYGVALLLKQLVQLSRYPATELFATTWEGPALPSVLGPPKAGEMRSRILDAVERFLIDYQAVNQK